MSKPAPSPPTHMRVVNAMNGTVCRLTLSIGDAGNVYVGEDRSPLTVSNLRRHLSAIVPAGDQILLLGGPTPYKVPKDDSFRDPEVLTSLCTDDEIAAPLVPEPPTGTEGGIASSPPTAADADAGARPSTRALHRLYLFSRAALTVHGPDPPPCVLGPKAVRLPTEPDPSPVTHALRGNPGDASPPLTLSPLHQALEVYERQFMLQMCRGRALADGADLRMEACRACISEQRNMSDALRAAASNLANHRNNLMRSHKEFSADFERRTAPHLSLLDNFEGVLAAAGAVSLHPALSLRAAALGGSGGVGTLLDTVPVEKERHWAAQCTTSHQRLSGLFGQLEADVRRTVDDRDEEGREDDEWGFAIKDLRRRLDTEASERLASQGRRLDVLMRNHGESVRIVMGVIGNRSDATSADMSSSSVADTQHAFASLEDLSRNHTEIVPSMESDDVWLAAFTAEVADAKTRATLQVRARLRQISAAQSRIQRVLSELSVLREALQQQCQNLVHLEHVRELPGAYREFLAEVRRRRAFSAAFSSAVAAVAERAASMRGDETRARERFLRGPGRHLMPAFFDVFAPTLASPPPLYAPPAVDTAELASLPDCDGEQALAEVLPVAEEAGGTVEQGDRGALIESASTVLEGGAADRAVAEAERAAMLYENAALRQVVERMGAKPPRSYVEEARAVDRARGADFAEPVDSVKKLRERMEELQRDLDVARTEGSECKLELKEVRELAQREAKISHSSFKVGDVALFMPTGRGIGGRRTYLAFHSSCPHRYLNNDSIRGNPDYVLGRIVFQEEHVAGQGRESNPFGLHRGTKFLLLTVEVVKVP